MVAKAKDKAKLSLIRENMELRQALRDLISDYEFCTTNRDRPALISGVNHAKRLLDKLSGRNQ